MSDTQCTFNGCGHAVSSSTFKPHFVRKHLGGDVTLYNTMHCRMYLRPIPSYTGMYSPSAASSTPSAASTALQLAAQLAAEPGGLDALPADAREALGTLVSTMTHRSHVVKGEGEEKEEASVDDPPERQLLQPAQAQLQAPCEGHPSPQPAASAPPPPPQAPAVSAVQQHVEVAAPCGHTTSNELHNYQEELRRMREEMTQMRERLHRVETTVSAEERDAPRVSVSGDELNADDQRPQRRSARLLHLAQPAAKVPRRSTSSSAAESARRYSLEDFFIMWKNHVTTTPSVDQESRLVTWESTTTSTSRRTHRKPVGRAA